MKKVKSQNAGTKFSVVQNPMPKQIASAAMDVVAELNARFPNPAAMVTTLRCALDIYMGHLLKRGYKDEVLKECLDIGSKLAVVALEPGAKVDTPSPIAINSAGETIATAGEIIL